MNCAAVLHRAYQRVDTEAVLEAVDREAWELVICDFPCPSFPVWTLSRSCVLAESKPLYLCLWHDW